MQSVTKLLLIVSFLLLTSCFIGPVRDLKDQIEESWENEDVPLNPTNLNKSVPLEIFDSLWNIDLGGEIDENIQFSLCGNKLFAANNRGYIFVINYENGKVLYKKELNENITAGITCSANNFYFVTNDGFAWALTANGDVLWKSFIGAVLTSPLVHETSVIFKTINNQFYSLDVKNGFKQWTYQASSPPLVIESWGSLSHFDGILYAGLPQGKCLALNIKNGSLIWEATYSQPKGATDIERASDTTSQPLSDEHFIYVVSSKGNIAALDNKNGNQVWSKNLSSFLGLTLFDNTIIVFHNSGAIYSIEKESGKVVWRNPEYINRDITKGKIFTSKLIISDYEGYLHFIDLISGKTISRLKPTSSKIIYHHAYNDKIFYAEKSGNLEMIKINDYAEFSYLTPTKKELQISADEIIDDENQKNKKSFIDELIFWD